MIEEDYCSYEVAKLLKEKGFDEECIGAYSETNHTITKFEPNVKNSKVGPLMYSAPTHQMAMKWLREVHKLTFIISPQWAEGDMRNPCRWYWEIRGLEDINIDVYNNPLCNTYEEAVESACIYSLENLI